MKLTKEQKIVLEKLAVAKKAEPTLTPQQARHFAAKIIVSGVFP